MLQISVLGCLGFPETQPQFQGVRAPRVKHTCQSKAPEESAPDVEAAALITGDDSSPA